jgi:hypothetical protein
MIIELGESIIDLGNHKSNCNNHLKPKNNGCTQEGDCSCKGNIGNEAKVDCSCGLTGTNCKAVKNKNKIEGGCDRCENCRSDYKVKSDFGGDCFGCERECGIGGPQLPVIEEEEKVITQIESSLIPNLIFEVFPKAKIEYEKKFADYENDSVILFNYLKAGESKPVPSEAVDEIWHNMILYTARYGDFCRKYFGRFVHHIPNDEKILNGLCNCGKEAHCEKSGKCNVRPKPGEVGCYNHKCHKEDGTCKKK